MNKDEIREYLSDILTVFGIRVEAKRDERTILGDDALKEIESLISENYIPKERVLTDSYVSDIIYVATQYLDIPDKDLAILNANIEKALLEAGSIKKVGIEEIKDTIVNNKITPELVEKHFPKGQCNERGNAIVLHAEMLIELARITADYLKEKE